MTRNSMQDYTLSLWFKAQAEQVGDIATLFAAGAGTTDEVAAEGHLFIGLNKGAVMVRQNGRTLQGGGNYLDDNWHGMGLIVNDGLGKHGRHLWRNGAGICTEQCKRRLGHHSVSKPPGVWCKPW